MGLNVLSAIIFRYLHNYTFWEDFASYVLYQRWYVVCRRWHTIAVTLEQQCINWPAGHTI